MVYIVYFCENPISRNRRYASFTPGIWYRNGSSVRDTPKNAGQAAYFCKSARSFECTDDERELVGTVDLLSLKPVIYAANMDEEGIAAWAVALLDDGR